MQVPSLITNEEFKMILDSFDTQERLVVYGVAVVFLSIVLLAISGMFVSNYGSTRGTHTGVVTAVETNSFIFTTKRAYFKTSTQTTQEDTYCVKNDNVYDKLVSASESGKEVSIKFEHPLVEWRWNCGGDDAIITSVDEVERE